MRMVLTILALMGIPAWAVIGASIGIGFWWQFGIACVYAAAAVWFLEKLERRT